jgi:hypothetical protein
MTDTPANQQAFKIPGLKLASSPWIIPGARANLNKTG